MVVSSGPKQLFAAEGRGNLGQEPNFGESLQLVCSHPLQCHCLIAFCSAGLQLVCSLTAPSSRPQALPSGGAKGSSQRQAESRFAQEHAISYLRKEGR